MDKVKLGRALGYGTRHAAKTLAAMAEAAAAPDPRPRASVPEQATVERPAGTRRAPARAAVRGAGRSMWGPLATFSSALWLRVSGVFFGFVAMAMLSGAWRTRMASPGSVEMRHLWLFAGFGALFAYFAVSSFVRASLRERRERQ